MEKWPFFRAATAGMGKYCMGGYGRIGVYRVNPLDPNPAVAARAVCPQSGRSRPEKRPFFHMFPHFSKIEQSKKVLPHIGVQYIKLKPLKFRVKCKRDHFVLISGYALVRI